MNFLSSRAEKLEFFNRSYCDLSSRSWPAFSWAWRWWNNSNIPAEKSWVVCIKGHPQMCNTAEHMSPKNTVAKVVNSELESLKRNQEKGLLSPGSHFMIIFYCISAEVALSPPRLNIAEVRCTFSSMRSYTCCMTGGSGDIVVICCPCTNPAGIPVDVPEWGHPLDVSQNEPFQGNRRKEYGSDSSRKSFYLHLLERSRKCKHQKLQNRC